MRIAQIAPLFESVPPTLHDGPESVVSWLTEELVRLGHEVTLFASGDSITEAVLVPVCNRALWSEPGQEIVTPHHMRQLEQVCREQDSFDVLHFHSGPRHVPVALLPGMKRIHCPSVMTIHGVLDESDQRKTLEGCDDVRWVSVSRFQQRSIVGANWLGTVQHGLPLDRYTFEGSGGDPLVFVGRAVPESGLDRAIEIARRARVNLKIAVNIYPEERAYYHQVIEPRLNEAAPFAEMIGEVGGWERDRLLGGARALLYPEDRGEPSGLVMMEAMACGTPVIAWRSGGVDEIVEDGVTGYLVDNIEQAIEAIGRVGALDRWRVRDEITKRFGVERMAASYVDLYRGLAGAQSGHPISEVMVKGKQPKSGRHRLAQSG